MKTVYVFPGQGAQYVGMGMEIAKKFSLARELYERASTVLGFDLFEICQNGSTEILKQTENAQPAILVTSLACFLVVQDKLPPPMAFAGLSLGEYTALVATGSISLEEAVVLVRHRGQFMQEATANRDVTMAAIMGLDAQQIDTLCAQASKLGVCEATNYNTFDQTVVGGDTSAVLHLIDLALSLGATNAVPLNVSSAFHTSLMQPAAERLRYILADIPIRNCDIPIVANATARTVFLAEEVRQSLLKQITSPVRWVESIQKLVASGADTFIEFGPGKILSGLIQRTFKEIQPLNIEDPVSMDVTLKSLTKLD